MKVRKYLDPFIEVVGIGPETSPCIKSSLEESLLSFPTSYFRFGCFLTKQPLQIPWENFMRGNPSTIYSLCNFYKYFKFRWPNLSFQSLLVSLAWVKKELWCEYGKMCQDTYALEEWFATPLAIIILEKIYEISIVSGSKITFFGEPVCVIW